MCHLRWLQASEIETAFIDPGKPWQNGADESFNGKLRDEYPTLQWFPNRVDAKVGAEQWRRHYNEVHPPFEPGLSHPGRVQGERCSHGPSGALGGFDASG